MHPELNGAVEILLKHKKEAEDELQKISEDAEKNYEVLKNIQQAQDKIIERKKTLNGTITGLNRALSELTGDGRFRNERFLF